MIKAQEGLWLVPTRGRVDTLLPRFLQSFKAAGAVTKGVLLVAPDDYAEHIEKYDALDLPAGWTIFMCNQTSTAAKCEEGLREFGDNKSWIGFLADDATPDTHAFDQQLIASLTGWNFVSCDDGQGLTNRLGTCVVWSADLIKAVGYLFPPGVAHNYVDDMWCHIGQLTGCWGQRPDILVRHSKPIGAGDATTKLTKDSWAQDEKAFQRWIDHDRAPTADRVLALMESYGIKMSRPDLSGINLMLATPCGDGKYEHVYVTSLMNTIRVIEQYGGKSCWREMNYCSDISLARNNLFGHFLRSDCTHMLFIDSDMGWEYSAVLTLLAAKKDLCAVAGPRKVNTKSFAVNVSDDLGNPIAVKEDPESGFLEVSGVGTGFMLMSRACAERLAQSYADLAYADASGRETVGVFNPLIVNRRYLSDDFAMCHRWRAIGGRIFVASEISLQHVGSHVWSGAWIEQLTEAAERLGLLAAE